MTSLKKNFIYNIFYQILAIILPFVTAPYVSRVLGAGGVGTYSYTYSIANYFVIFAMLGIANHGNRSIASTPKDRRILGQVFIENYVIQLFFGIVILLLYFLYCCTVGKNYYVYLLLQVPYVMSAVLDINWFFWGLENFKLTVIRNAICKILSVICIFTFVNSKGDLWVYTLIMSMTIFTSQLLLWIFVKREIDICKPNWNNVKNNIKPILVMFIPIVSYSLYRMMDKIMIGSFSSMDELGFYENAEKILNIPIGIVTALGNVMLPRMSNLVAEGKEIKQKEYIRNSLIFVSILEGAICFGISSVACSFAPLYFGTEFYKTGVILRIIVFTALISGWANVIRTQLLIPRKMDNIYVFSMLSAALINFILNIVLIPIHGAYGAVVGTVAAESIVLIIQWISVRTIINSKECILENLPYVIIGLAMFCILNIINSQISTSFSMLVVEIILGVIIYCNLLLIYSYFAKNFIYEKLNRVLRKRNIDE